MKKLLLTLVIFAITLNVTVQNDVTKFLGIPVDGTKSEMLQKLKAKGFTSSPYDNEILEGEFNGEKVRIHIVTNGNKVYRIMIVDQIERDETNIKIRFNKLCQQFENNSKYQTVDQIQIISDNEDIGYEILVNNKRYEATFYQGLENDSDSTAYVNELRRFMFEKNLAGEIPQITAENAKQVTEQVIDEFIKHRVQQTIMKPVWFMISEGSYNKYYILMYYDNEYNRANGEDL